MKLLKNNRFHAACKLFLAFTAALFALYACDKDKKLPEVSTMNATNITASTATSGGEITSEGDAKVTARGICWSSDHIPSTSDAKNEEGKGEGTYTSNITGFKSYTTYYVRTYATNRYGTAYGNTVSLTTLYDGELVTDIDGNVYHTITIGTQVWMLENLRVTRFRNGDTILYIADSNEWGNFGGSSPRICGYENNSLNVEDYGYLYNQFAVLNNTGIAPVGWHIPTKEEFQTLIDYVGGESLAGGLLKENGFVHWMKPNLGADNESGFKALPGGRRTVYGRFEGVGSVCNFATTTHWCFLQINYNSASVLFFSESDATGTSVRCIKD